MLILVIFSLMVIEVSGQTNEPEVIVNDGRVTGVNIQAGQTYSESWNIKENDWYSINMDCQDCTATLSLEGDLVGSSTSSINGMASSDGIMDLSIESSINEVIDLSIIHHTNDNYQSIRPSPLEVVPTITGEICAKTSDCLDHSRGDLASIPNGEFTNSSFITGVIDSGQSEYFVINVSKGDTLELSLVHSSSDLFVEVYFQNQSEEELLIDNISSPSQLTTNHKLGPNYWNFDDDGRAVVKVESQSTNTVWVLQQNLFKTQELELLPANMESKVYGHNFKNVLIDVSSSERLSLNSPYSGVEVSSFQLMSGQWVESGSFTLQQDVISNLYVYPNVSAMRIEISAQVFLVEISVEDFSDLGQGLEAPSLAPIYLETDNSSWPTLDLEKSIHNGQFTLPIFDHSDVYKIEITGWEDSIHFVKFTVEGDIEDCEVELIEKNQETWENKETKVRTIASGDIQVALELDRGTHFLRISIINSSVYNNTWGENIDSKQYTITSQYELVDEGEEPWFPPDENAEKWGSIARWFMGGLFLIPGIIVLVLYKKNLNFANSLSNKKKRLEWLKSRLDEGIATPKQSRKFLKRALDSISTLEWNSACEIWGEYDIEHRTDGLAMVAWKLDERLSKDSASWPIIIGLNIIQGNWEMAALRLDAPEGEPWNITSVHPRFLSKGEEVFLDSMVEGNIVFITVEIEGSSKCVDVELNGRLDGEPFAARIPTTLWRNSDSEE